jgi:hypothetical protein
MHADRASDISVAPLALPVALARSEFREGRRGRLQPVRVNERADERPEMPSVWRRPLPRNALSGARLGPSPAPRLGHRGAGCLRLCTPSSLLAETVRAGFLSTSPAASGRHASLNLDVVRRLLQPITTRGHTLRAIDPRTRVRLSPRYTPAPTDASCVGPYDALPHRGPASRVLRAPAFAVVLRLRGRSRSRAGTLERRRAARS